MGKIKVNTYKKVPLCEPKVIQLKVTRPIALAKREHGYVFESRDSQG